jgi:aspartyl-tRNA(Asn)/glutamyl-tRNA(Gln) amidotransferase subunit C
MTSATPEQIRKIAKLSRINITDDEVEIFTNELSKIMTWVDQLQEVDTDGIPQLASIDGHTLEARADEANDETSVEDIMANAPESRYHFFTVPKVVE